MKYLQIVEWDKWQTYRTDRGTPPWIKVHRNLLTNPEWAALSDSEKGQLVSIWLIAADKDGRVPADAKLLQKVALLDKPPNINRFKDLEFLASSGCQDDVNSPQDDAPETETETETETEKPLVRKSGYEECDFELAELMFKNIQGWFPNFMQPNLESWGADLNKMRRLDKITIKEMGDTWNVIQLDTPDAQKSNNKWQGWRSVIRSPQKFREKFQQIRVQLNLISVSKVDDRDWMTESQKRLVL